ncbi:MAG: hypothetical protein L0271_25735 [Gemmatimonadetes bacterium]|nr:hypothetical protein [Gemmatimonadota bacterium]
MRARIVDKIPGLRVARARCAIGRVLRGEIRTNESRHVTLAPALLIRCPDAHTAARVLASGGNAVRSISDTVVELLDPAARTRLIKKLRGLAVFVEEHKPAEKRRPSKRQRW